MEKVTKLFKGGSSSTSTLLLYEVVKRCTSRKGDTISEALEELSLELDVHPSYFDLCFKLIEERFNKNKTIIWVKCFLVYHAILSWGILDSPERKKTFAGSMEALLKKVGSGTSESTIFAREFGAFVLNLYYKESADQRLQAHQNQDWEALDGRARRVKVLMGDFLVSATRRQDIYDNILLPPRVIDWLQKKKGDKLRVCLLAVHKMIDLCPMIHTDIVNAIRYLKPRCMGLPYGLVCQTLSLFENNNEKDKTRINTYLGGIYRMRTTLGPDLCKYGMSIPTYELVDDETMAQVRLYRTTARTDRISTIRELPAAGEIAQEDATTQALILLHNHTNYQSLPWS